MTTYAEAPAVQPSSAADEIEWCQLEASSDVARAIVHDHSNQPTGETRFVWRDWAREHADHSVKYSDRPHPLSYGADLPMRTTFAANGYPKIAALTAAEKKYLNDREKAPKTLVRASSAHPDSYRPDLPLRGMCLESRNVMPRWTLTKEEKALLADRPLRYSGKGGASC